MNISGVFLAFRVSVVFDTIPPLLACLEMLVDDPDVLVIRVKNNLDPTYDALATAGFRYHFHSHIFKSTHFLVHSFLRSYSTFHKAASQ